MRETIGTKKARIGVTKGERITRIGGKMGERGLWIPIATTNVLHATDVITEHISVSTLPSKLTEFKLNSKSIKNIWTIKYEITGTI